MTDYYDTSYPPSLWTPPEPPPVVDPTGTVQGAPGSFTPVGSETPANLTELNALGALGQTVAWVGGTYVVLGDASHAYWNATTWVSGNSPTVPEEPVAEPEEESTEIVDES